MMLRLSLGMPAEADRIEAAVEAAPEDGTLTPDLVSVVVDSVVARPWH